MSPVIWYKLALFLRSHHTLRKILKRLVLNHGTFILIAFQSSFAVSLIIVPKTFSILKNCGFFLRKIKQTDLTKVEILRIVPDNKRSYLWANSFCIVCRPLRLNPNLFFATPKICGQILYSAQTKNADFITELVICRVSDSAE